MKNENLGLSGGTVTGSFYRALGITTTATNDEIAFAAELFARRSKPADCPRLGDWVADEIVNVLCDPTSREKYDAHIDSDPDKPWPTPWTFHVRLATPGIQLQTDEKFCDVCYGYPARDVTIPQIFGRSVRATPDEWIQHNGGTWRCRSHLVVRRCQTCGLNETGSRFRLNGVFIVLLMALTPVGFINPDLGIVTFFAGLVLTLALLGFAWARVRFASLPKPSRVPY